MHTPSPLPMARSEDAPEYGAQTKTAAALGLPEPADMLLSELLDTAADVHDLDDTRDVFRILRELPPAKRWRVDVALELARRIAYARIHRESRPLHNSAEVFKFLRLKVVDLQREIFACLYLDGKNRVIRDYTVSIGTLTSALVHPREVFAGAVRTAAAGVVLYHNHPSGDPHPSREDREITRRLVATGEVVGVRVLDHLILGDGGRYLSFADEGLL